MVMSAAMAFSKGFKNEFEIAVVNQLSMFEPLKFYCIQNFLQTCVLKFVFYKVERQPKGKIRQADKSFNITASATARKYHLSLPCKRIRI